MIEDLVGILAVMASESTVVTMAAEVEVKEVTTATITHVWVVVPYPLLPPIPIVVLRGGMERTTTAHATAFEDSRVQGFEGSIPGPHPEGIIGPRGLW